jgi:hypothetical protein
LTQDGHSTPLAWVQDGRMLLIGRPGQLADRQQRSELWTFSLGDGTERRVSENAAYPAVSGSQVAYLRFIDRGHWAVAVTDLTAVKTPISLGQASPHMPPRWVGTDVLYLHPSGQVSTSGQPGLHPLPVQTSVPQLRARLSPDGRYVAATDGQRLSALGADGQFAIAHAGQIWGFAWSPDGARLAYVRSDSGPMPELWIWDASSGRSRMLLRGESEHFGLPAWSPDGRTLALARHPTGNGYNAAGDIWLVDADGAGLYPLARTIADERAPCWSPDGRALAFALNGDVWIADLHAHGLDAALVAASGGGRINLPSLGERSDAGEVAPLGLTAPLTIRVKHDGVGNTCRPVPDGQVDVFDFEAYLKRVVPYEISPSWPTEALKAQAVAARTYAWRKLIDRRAQNPDPGYDVWDSTNDQYMCTGTSASTNAAVDDTVGQYVSFAGKVIYAFFCAEAGSPTHYRNTLGLATVPHYLRPVDDPVSFGQLRNGHSVGLSQWGAYRWAAWHGWDYGQILSHYYSAAAIERSPALTRPLVSLPLPWSDFYVNTDRAYLQANATDGTGVFTVTFAARITDTWTTVYTDTDGGDGWGYVWPVAGYTDTVTPSVVLRGTAYNDHGQAVVSGISRMGLNRTAPTGTLRIASAEVNTLTVSFALTAIDPSPVSGTIRVGLGAADWQWQDTVLPYLGGEIVSDSAATDGSAWHVSEGQEGILFGPYAENLPPNRPYRAYFRLKVPTAALTSPLELAKLDVATDGGDTLLGVRYLRGTDVKVGETYQEFAMDFDYPPSGGELEFRVDVDGQSDLWVDRVIVVSYPIDVSPLVSWTLPAREGPNTTTAKFIDRAENVSLDVALAITVTDDGPPEWRAFQCDALTCALQVRDVIAGLDVGSMAVRYSTDGGVSWSGWLSATCTGVRGSHDWETTSVANTFFNIPGDVAVQFRAFDVATASNEGHSPAYRIRRLYLPVIIR